MTTSDENTEQYESSCAVGGADAKLPNCCDCCNKRYLWNRFSDSAIRNFSFSFSYTELLLASFGLKTFLYQFSVAVSHEDELHEYHEN